MTNIKKIKVIEEYQIFGMNPILCKSENCASILEPKEVNNNLKLFCNDCGYFEEVSAVPVILKK